MPTLDPGLKRLAQVAIVCRNIEHSAARWAAVLGVELPPVFTTPPGLKCRMTFRGAPSDAQAKLAFFHLENISIELIEPLGGDSSWQEGLDRQGESVHHVAFQVEDLEAALAHFARQGMDPIHRGRFGGDDGTFVYLDSASALGATVELLHHDPR
jgi:catechol 2,3-dioxygenase-like lactoylglutathione lyase family enzyme